MRVIESINLTAYTEEAFYRCFPDAAEGYYENYIDVPISEQLKQMEKANKCRIDNLRLIPISDLYFDLIEEEGYENTTEMRTQFMAEVDDKLAQKLWDNSEMGRVPGIYTIVIHTFSDISNMLGNIKLDDQTLKNIKNVIREHYGVDKEDVFCINTLYRADYLEDIKEQVEDNCILGLCGERLIQYDNSELDKEFEKDIKSQSKKHKNKSDVCLQSRVLTFAVYEKTRFKLTRQQALEDDIMIADCELSNVLETKLVKILRRFFVNNKSIKEFNVMPLMIPIDETIDVIEDTNKALKDALKELNKI